jgi:argininosuccinate lyase
VTFAPEYVACVLNQNFDDAKDLFYAPLMAIHYAHLVMLASQDILSTDEAHTLRVALDGVSARGVSGASFDGSCEDLFFFVEQRLVEECGETDAGRLHTARSRNDIDMTMYRMRQREFILGLTGAVADLRGTLLDLADRHVETIFAVHTHTQRAQPTTVAHYLLAIVEQLERDASRLRAAYERTASIRIWSPKGSSTYRSGCVRRSTRGSPPSSSDANASAVARLPTPAGPLKR